MQQPTKEWAELRLAQAQQRLARARTDERYAEWYVRYLLTRIDFYSGILATLKGEE